MTLGPGDLLLLHGCCHNPTGADLAPDQWRAVADLVAKNGLIPYVDLAYQGLGNGLEAEPWDRGWTRLYITRPLDRYGPDEQAHLMSSFAEFIETLEPLRREAVSLQP